MCATVCGLATEAGHGIGILLNHPAGRELPTGSAFPCESFLLPFTQEKGAGNVGIAGFQRRRPRRFRKPSGGFAKVTLILINFCNGFMRVAFISDSNIAE